MTVSEMALKVLESMRTVDLLQSHYETGLDAYAVIEALREQIEREQAPFSIEVGGTNEAKP